MKKGIASIGSVATGTSAKTLLQLIAATNHGIQLSELSVGFSGVDNTHAPVLVELVRQTDAGSGSSALTLEKENDSDGDSFDTTAIQGMTGEPTGSTVVRRWRVHPQAGSLVIFWGEHGPKVGDADRLGLRVTAANDVNATVYVVFEE